MRKSGEASLQEKCKQEKIEPRVEKRTKNLSKEKDVVKGELIKPIEHLKVESTK
jgi:hypothetical protein